MFEVVIRKKLLPCALLLLVWSGWATAAMAQTSEGGQPYTLAVRGAPLDEALERFARVTGLALAYDPSLVRGHEAFCAAERAPAEDVLRCLLEGTGLDFYRLSSGTYVLTPRAELPPQPGFLAGLVTDRATGAPLPDAHVYLASAGSGGVSDGGSVTNRSGQFVFPPLLPGRYVVRVSHLGYDVWQDTLHVAAHEQTRAEAALQAEPIFITPVVVDGLQERAATRLGQEHLVGRDASAERLAEADVAYRHAGTLAGVRTSDVTADVHVQAGEAGEHELRLDGVPVYLPRPSVGLVGPFGAFALDRLTVHKAGFDASWGSLTSGVVLAEHALAATSRADVQVDPLSLNARLQLAPQTRGPSELAVMAAARVGLWGLYAPPPLRATLDAWGAPDPFLLAAPLATAARQGDAEGASRAVASLADLEASTFPELHFSDVHAAARLRLGPLRTLHASAYEGRSRLAGGPLSPQRDAAEEQLDGGGPLTVVDDYRWRNRLAQARYDAVLGSRTLASAQVWASQYALRHDYEVFDSVFVEGDGQVAYLDRGPTTPVQDGNDVQAFAFAGSLDHAEGPHRLRVGAEVTRTESAFALYDVRFPTLRSSAFAVADLSSFRPYEYSSLHQSVYHTAASWRVAAYAADAWALTERLEAEGGLRLTYLPDRADTYAEPRLALRYAREGGPLGPWSARVAAGVYRQFTSQMDVSLLNAGALLPSVRVWLPLDPSVRPPLTYHVAPSFLLQPSPQWRVHVEGFYKRQPHGLAIRYAPVGAQRYTGQARTQTEFLTATRGRAYGGMASLERKTARMRLQARYAYSHAARRSPDLFGGRLQPVPWNEPHRVEIGLDWTPTSRLTLSARTRGVWGRTWGFRQAYYDYFGHGAEARIHGPYDLGRPSEHVLPPFYALDLSLAYARSLGAADLQLRLDVLNATDRRNVADWRLAYEGGTWRKEPRYLYPRMPSVAVRVGF